MENTTATTWHKEQNVGNIERIFSALAAGGFLYAALAGKQGRVFKGSLGAFLLYRAATGICPAYSAMGKYTVNDHPQNVNIRATLVVNKPRSEVYAFWRKLEQLPLFMKHLESVTQINEHHSLWKAQIPGLPGSISWEAEIVKDVQDSFLGWRSLPGAAIENAGKVEFRDAGNSSTEIYAVITYRAPLGIAGEKIARLLNPLFKELVKEDLHNFRQYIDR